jgi:hypothetical protein
MKTILLKKKKKKLQISPRFTSSIGKLENKNNSNNILDFETIFCGLFSKKCPPFCKFSGGVNASP